MRLHISWKLERGPPALYATWRDNADALRLDTDVNNAHATPGEMVAGSPHGLVGWHSIQRVIEQYRSWINQHCENSKRRGRELRIRPDMDNTFVENAAKLSGISDVQRYSVASHWLGAGASRISGSDQRAIDPLGRVLNGDTDAEARAIADFTSNYAMVPPKPRQWEWCIAAASGVDRRPPRARKTAERWWRASRCGAPRDAAH